MLCPRYLALHLSLSLSLSLALLLPPLSLPLRLVHSQTHPHPHRPRSNTSCLSCAPFRAIQPPTLGICHIWLTHVSAALARNMHHIIPHCMSRPRESSFYIRNIGKTPAGHTPRSSTHQACTELRSVIQTDGARGNMHRCACHLVVPKTTETAQRHQ